MQPDGHALHLFLNQIAESFKSKSNNHHCNLRRSNYFQSQPMLLGTDEKVRRVPTHQAS